MRTKNKFLAILLIVCMCFGLNISAVASDTETAFSSDYSEFCDDYYANHSLYTVYDKNNNDISAVYYNETIDFYNQENFDAIHEYMKANVSYYSKTLDNPLARGSIATKEQGYPFYYTVEPDTNTPYEITVWLTGVFSYSLNTGQVTSVKSVTLTLTDVGIAGAVSASMTQASTSSTIASNGVDVTFKGNFKMTTTVVPGVGIPLFSDTTGPYYAQFTMRGDL